MLHYLVIGQDIILPQVVTIPALGYYTMLYNVDGTGNTAVGSQAMKGVGGNSHTDNCL